jgi:polysaccharide pyruvyl transferase CsaB
MKYHVAISGSYGGLNLGDEAILEGILKELRASLDVDVVVFSYNAKDTESRHHVRAIPIREVHKDEVIEILKKLDLLILGGGGILFDGVVETFLRDVAWAQELKIPVMVYAVSAGPLKSPESKQLVSQVLNKAEIITVREAESKRILHDLGITKPIEVTGDPALLIKPQLFTKEMLKKDGIDPDGNLIGFSAREPGLAAPELNIDHYHAILANAADFMIERYNCQILFIPFEMGANRDPQMSHAIISKMLNARYASVLKSEYNSGQTLGLMKHLTFAVGMRVHFLIFAALQGIPFVSLPYASKVKGFLEDLEMPYTPVEHWNTGKLCALIDYAWDNRKTIAKKLDEKIPPLQEKAKKTNAILCDFLKSINKSK